ncbi:hypothetical protein CARUB_v100167701mg, partial [Capsella rubella]
MGLHFREKAWILLAILCFSSLVYSTEAVVTYDQKSLIINGQRRILLSGSIHYPRSTPEMWPDLLRKAKEGGLDVIQTYVFWNGHEPSPGNGISGLAQICPWYSFQNRQWTFQDCNAKIHKEDCGYDESRKAVSDSRRSHHSLTENEYGPMQWEMGAPGKAYSKWTAEMALGLSTGVPWIMCKQEDAPYPIIDTCNGFYCEGFKPNSDKKPKLWTENWTGWFTEFGGPIPNRPVEDIAFSVARFIHNGGSLMNYYMYYGGTNFDRTAGVFIATSYDYDAPIDEYGLPREPKYSHLKELHKVIKMCEPTLVSVDPTITSLGNKQEAHVFKSRTSCAAFLSNYDTIHPARVIFRGFPYDLPPWSISILPDCKTEYHNTAKIRVPSILMKMVPTSTRFSWKSYKEGIPSSNEVGTFAKDGLVEQISMTRDKTDYFWYLTDITISPDEKFVKTGDDPLLTICSAGHALHVFVNGQLSGTSYGALSNSKLTFSQKIKLRVGINKLALLSTAVGLPNAGVHYETWNTGVLGPATLNGVNSGTWDMSKWKWSYKIGTRGEALSLHTLTGSSSVEWIEGSFMANKQPLTWYK